jgi:hypothetical protein
MKINRRQLRRIIESVINESQEGDPALILQRFEDHLNKEGYKFSSGDLYDFHLGDNPNKDGALFRLYFSVDRYADAAGEKPHHEASKITCMKQRN